jgi:hypothetical protein
MTTTGAAIILAAQERADLVGSGFVSSAEWLRYLNASYKEMYGLVTQKFGNDYFAQTPNTGYTFTTDGLVSRYALPSDFFKLLGVDLVLSGSGETAIYATLKPFNWAERNRYALPNVVNWLGRTNLRYRLNGNEIWFQPLPVASQTIRLFYVPRPAELDGTGGAGDVVDGVCGWEELVVTDLAIKGKQKAEEDVSVLMAQKQALVQRLESEAENRDAGSPATISDVSREGAGGMGTGWGQEPW